MDVPELYGLTRIDQPSKCTYGWYVRIQHLGKARQKWFADADRDKDPKRAREISKGKAIAYRDHLLRSMPEKKIQLRRDDLPQSGRPGVRYVIDRAGERQYHYWMATHPDGTTRQKFAISRYGNDGALQMANASRDRFESEHALSA